MLLLKILSIALLILFPFGEVLRFDLGNNVAVRPIDGVAGILGLVWLIYSIKEKHFFHINWKLLAFPLVALLSLLVNTSWLRPNELTVSSLYLMRWVSYLSLYPVISAFSDVFKKKLSFILFADGLFICFAGFFQMAFYPKLKNLYYLGWDDHMYRLYSVFFDPNFCGAFLALFFIFAAAFAFGYYNKKQHILLLSSSIISVVALIALLLTYSRSALLMVSVVVTIFFFMINRKRVLILFAVLVAVYIIAIAPRFYIISINLFRTASTNARLYNYNSALKVIANNPLLGVGFDTFRYAKTKYGIKEGWAPAPSHADAGVDNSFLFLLATTGITGFTAYLFFLITLIKNAYNSFHRQHVLLDAVAIASLVGLMVDSLFINSLFYPELMLWIWVIAGFIGSRLP